MVIYICVKIRENMSVIIRVMEALTNERTPKISEVMA